MNTKKDWRSKERRKRNLVYTIDKEYLQKVIKTSQSFGEVLRKLGLSLTGSSYRVLRNRINEEHLNIDHWLQPKHRNRPKTDRLTSVEVLTENSFRDRSTVRSIIKREKLLEEICSICGLCPEWNNKPLTLRLDHINGINNDHRIENLRWVCPNCDSQLPTYGSKNIRTRRLGEKSSPPQGEVTSSNLVESTLVS